MTTVIGLVYGRYTIQNIIDLEPAQAAAFFTRQDIGLTSSQQAQCTGTGYVMVRYQGYVVGIGVYRAHRGIVESMFPKNWVQEKVQV